MRLSATDDALLRPYSTRPGVGSGGREVLGRLRGRVDSDVTVARRCCYSVVPAGQCSSAGISAQMGPGCGMGSGMYAVVSGFGVAVNGYVYVRRSSLFSDHDHGG